MAAAPGKSIRMLSKESRNLPCENLDRDRTWDIATTAHRVSMPSDERIGHTAVQLRCTQPAHAFRAGCGSRRRKENAYRIARIAFLFTFNFSKITIVNICCKRPSVLSLFNPQTFAKYSLNKGLHNASPHFPRLENSEALASDIPASFPSQR
jgi:hypothetical protein